MKFLPDETGLNGAVKYLRSHHEEDFNRFVFVTSSSLLNDTNGWADYAGVIVDYSLSNNITSNIFCSENQNKENISIHLFQNQLLITHYSLLTRNVLPNHYPRSWVLDASNDNITWFNIDEQNDCDELKGKDKHHTFPVSHPGKYRYFRFTNTDYVWNNNDEVKEYYFCLAKVEFFGNLIPSSITCKKSLHLYYIISIYLFINLTLS